MCEFSKALNDFSTSTAYTFLTSFWYINIFYHVQNSFIPASISKIWKLSQEKSNLWIFFKILLHTHFASKFVTYKLKIPLLTWNGILTYTVLRKDTQFLSLLINCNTSKVGNETKLRTWNKDQPGRIVPLFGSAFIDTNGIKGVCFDTWKCNKLC